MSWRRDWVVVRTNRSHPSEQGIFALSTKKTGMIRQGCSDASSICEHFQRLTIFQLTFLLFAQTGAEFAITGMKSRQKGAAYGHNREDGRGLYDRRTAITLERRLSKLLGDAALPEWSLPDRKDPLFRLPVFPIHDHAVRPRPT